MDPERLEFSEANLSEVILEAASVDQLLKQSLAELQAPADQMLAPCCLLPQAPGLGWTTVQLLEMLQERNSELLLMQRHRTLSSRKKKQRLVSEVFPDQARTSHAA